MLVASFNVHKMAAERVNARRIRTRARIERNVSEVVSLIGHAERACVESRLSKLSLLYDRVAKDIIVSSASDGSSGSTQPTRWIHSRG